MKRLTVPAVLSLYVALVIAVAVSSAHVTKVNKEKKELKAIAVALLDTPNLR